MDTKSKNFNDIKGVRVLAFVLCVGVFTATLVCFINTEKIYESAGYDGGFIDNMDFSGTYAESRLCQKEYQTYVDRLLGVLFNYRASKDYAAQAAAYAAEIATSYAVQAAGDAASQQTQAGSREVASASATSAPDTGSAAPPAGTGAEPSPGPPVAVDTTQRVSPLFPEEEQTTLDRQALEDRRAQLEDQASQAAWQAEQAARDYERLRRDLENTKGLGFHISDGENTIGNTEAAGGAAALAAAFRKQAAWLTYEDGELRRYPAAPEQHADVKAYMERMLEMHSYDYPGLRLYLSFDEEYIADKSLVFERTTERARPWVLAMLIGLALALALFLYLVVTTGRRDENGKRKLCAADRVFTELQLAAILVSGCIGVVWLAVLLRDDFYVGVAGLYISWPYSAFELTVLSAVFALMAAAGLWFLLSLTRNLKARRFLQNTLIWRLCRLLYKGLRLLCGNVRGIFDKRNPMTKVVLLALAVCLLSATIVLAPAVFVLVLVFGPRQVRKFADIKKGVDEVRNGNLSWRIPVAEESKSSFDELARGINEISGASNAAVQNELKNQRLKTDLISNVSHDLKTPLTSIITYIDLLKREGPESPSAPEYLDVLDQKAQRLKKLTEDLFEAAKVSSGAIPVRMEKVDLLSLIRQGLGEMNEGIAARRLDVRLNAESEKYYVYADGQLLWRIVENLLNNVQKYALEGSRVYIDLLERNAGGLTVLEIKNISNEPLNISADELTERFIRGDESRTTDGSGLGLAIAKDLAKLQNGWFELKIDGDLFKASLMLEKWAGAA